LENKGFCKNINNALRNVTVEKYTFFYILFQGDWIEPEFINTAVEIFNSNNEISFVEFRTLNHLPDIDNNCGCSFVRDTVTIESAETLAIEVRKNPLDDQDAVVVDVDEAVEEKPVNNEDEDEDAVVVDVDEASEEKPLDNEDEYEDAVVVDVDEVVEEKPLDNEDEDEDAVVVDVDEASEEKPVDNEDEDEDEQEDALLVDVDEAVEEKPLDNEDEDADEDADEDEDEHEDALLVDVDEAVEEKPVDNEDEDAVLVDVDEAAEEKPLDNEDEYAVVVDVAEASEEKPVDNEYDDAVEHNSLLCLDLPHTTTDYDPFYSNLVNSDYYMSNLLKDEIIRSCVSPGNRVFRNFGILFDETKMNGIDSHCLNTGSGYDFIFIYKHLLQKHKFYYYYNKPLCNFLSHDNSCSVKSNGVAIKNTLAGVKYCIDNYKKIYLDV